MNTVSSDILSYSQLSGLPLIRAATFAKKLLVAMCEAKLTALDCIP